MLLDCIDFKDASFLETKGTFCWDEFIWNSKAMATMANRSRNRSSAGGSNTESASPAVVKEIQRQPTKDIKAASRQSSETDREAKRARKAERNRRKANAAKRRG